MSIDVSIVTSRTVSLEKSAYERFRLAKRPGESFTDTINRLLADSQPSFGRLAGVLSREDARLVREGIQEMRALELRAERARFGRSRKTVRGRDS